LLAYAGLASTVLMNLVTPWPLKFIFDYILFEKPMPETMTHFSSALGNDKSALLTILCIGMVLVVFLEGFFSYTYKYFMARAGESMINDIRRRAFDHLQSLSQEFHGTSRTGDLVLRLTSDILSLKSLLIGSVETFAIYVLTVVGVTATMLWMNWELTLIALAVVPALYLMSLHFSEKVQALAQQKRTKEGEVAAIIQETLTSMAIVQAFTRERQEGERFARTIGESLEADLGEMRVARTLRRAVRLVIAVGTALVVWYGARHALTGAVTPGDLIVFMAYLNNLYDPITGFSGLMVDFTNSLVCGERIVEILGTEITVKDIPGAIKAPLFRGEVAFENVTFGYRDGEPVLQDLSFTVKPGQMVALVGSSGTGKSTVVNLLLRFYDPWKGQILIDGQDIRRFKLKSLRERMSVVFQESILFRRTIQENIAYGNPKASFEEIVAAAKAALAHNFIIKLPDGYMTLLDELGGNLSGGQRQRIALARAILRNAPILILDEPVTGLDAMTEAQVRETMARLMKGKTTFVVAHRFATVTKADLILVIEEGRVTEQGTHVELLASSSLYRHFYTLQYEQVVSGETRGGDAQ
jgi:ATP-binding cassette subfamily B protein